MLFGAVDSWLERVSSGQIRRPQPGEKECMQCRVLGSTRESTKLGPRLQKDEGDWWRLSRSYEIFDFQEAHRGHPTPLGMEYFPPLVVTCWGWRKQLSPAIVGAMLHIKVHFAAHVCTQLSVNTPCTALIVTCQRGTCVFGAAGLHSAMEAFRASARSTNRCFFGLVATAFLTAATWRAVTPTVPVHWSRVNAHWQPQLRTLVFLNDVSIKAWFKELHVVSVCHPHDTSLWEWIAVNLPLGPFDLGEEQRQRLAPEGKANATAQITFR